MRLRRVAKRLALGFIPAALSRRLSFLAPLGLDMAASPLSMQIDRARRMTRFGRIIARYDAGEPVDQIADDYECHRSTVLRNARMAGVT